MGVDVWTPRARTQTDFVLVLEPVTTSSSCRIRTPFQTQRKIEIDGEEDEDFDNKLFGVGIGPVIGININAGNVVTPAFTFGCLYTHYSGKGTYHSGYDEFEQDYSINEMTYFINFSLLFRVNDVF